MHDKICFTQKELARRWTLSHRTLERWRWVGKGPAFMKIVGQIVYRLDDVLVFEHENLHLTAGRTSARVV